MGKRSTRRYRLQHRPREHSVQLEGTDLPTAKRLLLEVADDRAELDVLMEATIGDGGSSEAERIIARDSGWHNLLPTTHEESSHDHSQSTSTGEKKG